MRWFIPPTHRKFPKMQTNKTSTPNQFPLLKPTNNDHLARGESTTQPEQKIGAPAALYVAGATYSYDDVVEIATRLRWHLKLGLQAILNKKFGTLFEPCHVYFGPVVDSSTTVPAFLYDFQVAWFPGWSTGFNVDNGSYLRNKQGWLIIDSYLDADSGEASIGVARATHAHYAMFINMANMIVDVIRALANRYQEWMSAEYADYDCSSVPSIDVLYLGLEELIKFSLNMPELIAEAEGPGQSTVCN